jgi:hypothetical protein
MLTLKVMQHKLLGKGRNNFFGNNCSFSIVKAKVHWQRFIA